MAAISNDYYKDLSSINDVEKAEFDNQNAIKENAIQEINRCSRIQKISGVGAAAALAGYITLTVLSILSGGALPLVCGAVGCAVVAILCLLSAGSYIQKKRIAQAQLNLAQKNIGDLLTAQRANRPIDVPKFLVQHTPLAAAEPDKFVKGAGGADVFLLPERHYSRMSTDFGLFIQELTTRGSVLLLVENIPQDKVDEPQQRAALMSFGIEPESECAKKITVGSWDNRSQEFWDEGNKQGELCQQILAMNKHSPTYLNDFEELMIKLSISTKKINKLIQEEATQRTTSMRDSLKKAKQAQEASVGRNLFVVVNAGLAHLVEPVQDRWLKNEEDQHLSIFFEELRSHKAAMLIHRDLLQDPLGIPLLEGAKPGIIRGCAIEEPLLEAQ